MQSKLFQLRKKYNLKKIGEFTTTELEHPCSICLDQNGMVLCVDRKMPFVYRYNIQGKIIERYNNKNMNTGYLKIEFAFNDTYLLSRCNNFGIDFLQDKKIISHNKRDYFVRAFFYANETITFIEDQQPYLFSCVCGKEQSSLELKDEQGEAVLPLLLKKVSDLNVVRLSFPFDSLFKINETGYVSSILSLAGETILNFDYSKITRSFFILTSISLYKLDINGDVIWRQGLSELKIHSPRMLSVRGVSDKVLMCILENYSKRVYVYEV